MKKCLLLVCCLAMVLSIFTSCGPSETDEQTDLPTLKIMTVDRANTEHSISKKSLIMDEIKKRTKVNLVIDAIPEANYTEIMNTRLAAGLNLPDIMFTGYSLDLKPAENKLYIALNDLIEKYAPNIKRTLDEEFPLVKKMNTAPDGNLYWVPGIDQTRYEGEPVAPVHGVSIRKDWMEKCGITKMPETTSEFYDVLKAFQDNDCNGNGKRDEVFVSWFGFQDAMLAWFGVPQGSITIDSDGKAKYIWSYENAYEYVKYMRKLYADGLLDQQIFNVTGELILKRVNLNKASAICYWADASEFNSQCGVEGAEYVPLNPLKTDVGTQGQFKIPATGNTSANFAITKDCKNTELAIKFIDWFYSEEARNMVVWGIEGVHCEKVDGKYKPKADYVERTRNATSLIDIDDVFSWVPCLPFVRITDWKDTIASTEDNPKAREIAEKTLELAMWEESVWATTSVALPTPSEGKLATQYANEMGTFAIEQITKFISGRSELTPATWAEFQRRLNNDFHLKERLEIFQAQYNRLSK